MYCVLKILGPGLEGMAMNELSACVLGSAHILTILHRVEYVLRGGGVSPS